MTYALTYDDGPMPVVTDTLLSVLAAEGVVSGRMSVGDFVLAGGEAAAIVVIEAVARLGRHGQRNLHFVEHLVDR